MDADIQAFFRAYPTGTNFGWKEAAKKWCKMKSMETRSFNSLVEQFLGTYLPEYLADQISLAELPSDAQQFILRMLSLMKRASYPATEFNPFLMRALSTFMPGALPSAWKGRIPPITMPGRHRKMDDYVAEQTRISTGECPVFVDLGCGFPPITTVETAQNLPNWAIFGVDRSFASYVLYDLDGHYACFNRDGEFRYFQSQMTESGRALNDDPAAARTHFETLFAALFPLLHLQDGQTSTTVEKNGNRLIHNHIRDFEASDLTFIEAEIQDIELPPARVIRCMNVLLYFEPRVKKKMLSKIGRLLHEEGIFIAGFNHILGSSARYAVYYKASNSISLNEFAFSLDNLRPIGVAPWYTIQEDDPEAKLLANLTGTVRTDKKFWPKFNRRVDDLLDHSAVCRRGNNGFLHFSKMTLPPDKLIGKMTALWKQLETEGYTAGAVDALCRAGYQAWENSVGDIAIKPSLDTLPMA